MKGQKGFTLIELLIVVAIIGILAAIAVPNFLHAQIRAKVARAESEMRSLQNALESFYIDNNTYPPMCSDRNLKKQYKTIQGDAEKGTIDVAHILVGRDRRIYLTTPVAYMTSIPFDPFHGDGHTYSYGYGSCDGTYYIIDSWGPDQADGLGGDNKLNEWEYTGARLNDLRRIAFRRAKSGLTLNRFVYDASNGVTSGGDIIKVGP